MESWQNKAGELIATNDWNGLYDLAQEWMKAETGSGIPKSLVFTSCHFTTPPKLEGAMELDLDEEDGGEDLPWLKSLPDGMCRNILYATALSTKNVEASNNALEEEAIQRPTPDVYIALGVSYTGTNREKGYYNQAINLDNQNPFALYKMGILQGKEGNREAAKEFMHRAIEACPDFVMAHYELSNIYAHEGNEELSHKHLKIINNNDDDSCFGKMVKEQLEEKRSAPPLSEPVSEAGSKLASIIQSGIKWGVGFLVVKVIYGFKNGHGAIESIFSQNGLIVFIIGFVAGALITFQKLND